MSRNVCEELVSILQGVGVERIFGVTGDALNLSGKLGGDRPTVLRVIAEFTRVLTELDLSVNDLGKEGAIAIANALKLGTSMLTSLNLSSKRTMASA